MFFLNSESFTPLTIYLGVVSMVTPSAVGSSRDVGLTVHGVFLCLHTLTIEDGARHIGQLIHSARAFQWLVARKLIRSYHTVSDD